MSRPVQPQNFVLSVLPLVVIAVLYSSLQCFAQTSRTAESNGKETPQSHRVRDATTFLKDFEQFAVYWTEEAGWHTDLQLRNNLASKELLVTPALRSADGTEANLSPVSIQPGDVVTTALHDALMKSAPQFAGKYGSVVLRYRAPVSKALNPPPAPTPTYHSPPTGTTVYMTATQNIYIGSDLSTMGVFVQQDTLTYYIDHGAHTSILIPPKPPQ